jgi:hypothetical protein
MDGKGVPMLKKDLREATRKAAEFCPVRDVLPRRPRPEDKRVWAGIKHSPEIIVKQMFEEAMRRDPKKSKQWVALVDGNETQLGLLQCAAEDTDLEAS